ncbi:MAG TPA: protein kinase [Thermoanaerobaculia bacterium]|nr:protein kinase [Thermoanaerobaculia bacterium]
MELIGRHFGHIRVTQVVGQGGMGDVYGGYDEKLERKVALKVLNDDQRLDAEARERLLREARALSKLDHPNICRIHDYIETRDVDLLVLEYIDGKTLHDAMQERMTHHEKLRIATAVADVLVQAHRAGIVHRDLKPENVMLTKSGEVKVLDFGLARWLHRKGKSSDRHIAIRPGNVRAVGDATETAPFTFPDTPYGTGPRRDFLATAVGITLGTPLFMSPEQARGESLTPASDMFSFGLLLQSLFTGEDPHPMNLTAREVILRVARGETQKVKGARGDVTALINRLKQFAPADRPTAVETAERLRFLHAKPQRIARRAIIAALALIALLGVWRYTVDLKRERALAVEAQDDSERRRAQVENLLEFMLGDLRQKLEPVGRLEILDDVGERTLEYVESLNPEGMSADAITRNAKALTQLGSVRMAQGNLPEAVKMYERALTFARVGATREPNHKDVQMAYGTAHFWLGDAAQKRGDLPRALSHMRSYLEIAQTQARRYPADETLQLERAYGHANVGSVLETQGKLRDALGHYQTSFEIKNARLQRAPSDVGARAELARAVNKLGRLQQALGDLSGARTQFENEVSTYRVLVQTDPRQTQWKQRLGASLAFLTAVRSYMGDLDGALECAREALSIDAELASRDPDNVDWQRNHAVALWRVAELHRQRGDLPRSLELLAQADSLMRAVLPKAPGRMWELELAGIDTTYAQALNAAKQRQRAQQFLEATLKLLESTDTAPAQARRADAWFNLGEIHRLNGDAKQAAAAWSNARAAFAEAGSSITDPRRLGVKLRVLARLHRFEEGRSLRAHLREIGYQDQDLEQICVDEGC